MSKVTELVSLNKDKAEDPRFAVCYARGSVFRPEGRFFRVEKGKRSLVSRALCLSEHFGKRCKTCPNHDFKIKLVSRGSDDDSA